MKTDADHIIDAIGGTSAVAELCQVTTGAVSQWRETGIPKARLMYLKLARPDVFDSLPVDHCAGAAMPEGAQPPLSRRSPQTVSGLGARPGSQTCAVGSTVAVGLTDESAADGATRTAGPAGD